MQHWASYLTTGDWQDFYRSFEGRYDIFPPLKSLKDSLPPATLWRSPAKSPQGKRVVVWSEQGAGDLIHFARYLRELHAIADHVTVKTYPDLATLFESQYYVDNIAIHRLPRHDLHCSLLSLPFLLNLDYCPTSPYLDVLPIDLEPGPFRVGLAWCGNAGYGGDFQRSCPLSAFAPLFEAKVEFWSLVKDRRPRRYVIDGKETEAIDLADHPPDWNIKAPDLTDWLHTATIIKSLDCVISVDTCCAHLAAAMGKPTFLLLPDKPDWRWSAKWYDTLTYAQQEKAGDWTAPMKVAVNWLAVQERSTQKDKQDLQGLSCKYDMCVP